MAASRALPRLHRLSRFSSGLGRRTKGSRRRRFLLGSLSLSGLLGALVLRSLGSTELAIDSVIGVTTYAFWIVGGLVTLQHLRAPTPLAERVAELRGLSAEAPAPRAIALMKKLFLGFACVAVPGLVVLALGDPRVWENAAQVLLASGFLALALGLLAFVIEATKVPLPRLAFALLILGPLALDPFGERLPHLAHLTARMLEDARPPLEGLE